MRWYQKKMAQKDPFPAPGMEPAPVGTHRRPGHGPRIPKDIDKIDKAYPRAELVNSILKKLKDVSPEHLRSLDNSLSRPEFLPGLVGPQVPPRTEEVPPPEEAPVPETPQVPPGPPTPSPLEKPPATPAIRDIEERFRKTPPPAPLPPGVPGPERTMSPSERMQAHREDVPIDPSRKVRR